MKNANSTFISSSFGLSWLRTSLNVAAFACASLLVITSLADAGGAQGARVRRGNVSFSQDGNRLVVRASNGSIIEYDRLSVEAGQIMQFIQPSSSSRVLNRVTGSELTRIDGTLLSNGIVYLVNPQGFRIGNGAVINVGGFFAAAGAMSNSDFVAGRNRFTNLIGEVTNEGLIQAKSVALVGQYVANRGTIDVGDGYVAMGAGDKVFIQDGTGPVMVTVSRSQMGADGSGAGTKAAISNTGTIDAGEGSVTMANGDFYSLAMDLSGTIVGKSIAARGGKGGVLAVNGTLDASSNTGKGGTIDVFGDRVGLFGDALVNANGATGGGSIRIGGDYLGTNAANAPQASRTFIGDNARVTANATQSGDGGRVIVWSNEYTGFFGTIEASAAASGKGGFVETSSHDNLQAFGSVDASSALGQAGTWLLDPSDVVIAAGSAGSLSAGVFDPVGTPASIGVVQINAALNAGTSVIINTASADAGAGNITMTGAISKTAGGDATLTLNAVGTIVLSQSISSTTGALSVALNAGGSVTMESVINTNGGTLAIVAGGAVTQGAASVLTIGGTTSVTTGGAAIALVGAGTNNFVGAVTLTNTGAFDVSVGSNTTLTLGAVSAGQNFSATTTSSINVTNTIDTLAEANGGIVTLNGAAGLTIGVAGDITSDGAVNLTSAGGINTAGDITTTGDVVNFNSATTMDGSIAVDTGVGAGDINFVSTLDLFFHSLTLTAGTGSVAFTGAVGDAPGNAIGTITINSAFNVTAASSINAASFRQIAGTGATTFNGAQTYSALAGLNVVTSGTIALNNTVTTIPPTGGNSGTVTLNGAAGLTIGALGDITSDGAVNLTGGGSAGISTAGNVTTTGDVVNFNSATTMDGSIAVNTGAGAGDINFVSTLDLYFYNLTLTAGTGSVAFTGAVGEAPGNAIGTITINSAFNVTAAAIQAASFRQLAGTGATTFNGAQTYSALAGLNVVTSGTIALNNSVTTLPPTGGNFGNVTLNGGAGLTIGALGDITSDGAVNLTGGGTGIHTAGDITTTAAVVNFNSATTLDGAVSIDTTNGGSEIGAAILFAGALDGNEALTLTAGAGLVSFVGLVGDSATLASLTVVSAGDISIGNAMKVTGEISITGNSGVDIFLGTAGVGLSLTDAELDFITEAGSLAITATGAGASITVNGVTGGGNVHGATLLTSNVDGVFFETTASTFNNSLAVVAKDVAVNALLGVTGSLSFTGNSGVNVIVGTGGVSTNLILSNAELARLTASSGLNVTATGAGATLNINGVTGGGNITGTTTLSSLQSTITFLNNASIFNNSLALVANNVDVTVALGVTGSISFTGNSGVDVFLGVSGPGLNLTNVELARLTASGGLNVTATGAGSSMTVNGVTGGGAITGTTTLSSDVDGVTFATTESTFNNALDVVGHTTIAGVNITTTSDSITFSGQVSLTTAGVSINTVSGDITFGDALNGIGALTLTAGAGMVSFVGAVGDSLTLGSLTIASAGDISIGNTMKVTGEISITGNSGVDIFLGTAGAGLSLTDVELDFITQAGSLAITARGTGASITVNGVTGGGNVDGFTRLASTDDKISFETTASTFDNSLTVVVSDLDIAVAIGVTGSMSIIGNTGVDIFNGTGGVGLSVTNAELALLTADNLNITSVGPLSSFIIEGVTGGGAITGTTTLTGSNGVTFSGSASSFNSALKVASIATIDSVGVTSTAGGVEFSNSVTLSGGGTSTITSSGIAGDIINVVGPIVATGDNSEALVVNAGLGDISFGGDIGASTKRLSALTLTAANTSFAGDVFVFGDLNVGNITLTGPTTLETNGLLTVGKIVGIGFALDLVANALDITDSITSVSVLTIRNVALDGDISIGGIATFDISQSEWDLIQASVNSVVLGSIVNTGAITVAGPWINNRAVTVNFLSGGAGEFNIDGAISGTGSLTVHGSGHSTNINADMTQASFNILDSVVVGGGAGTRTLTATAVGGIVINSTGFVDGISADAAATSLALLTTFATAPISVTGTFTAVGGSALTNLTMSGNGGVDAGTITLAASGTILGAILADVASGINLNSNAGTLTAASMLFGEDTTLTGATILAATAGDINFGTDPATATLGGAFGITLTLTASGNATFTDLITLTGAAGSFAFTGNNLTLNGVGTNAIGSTMTVTNTGLFTTYNGGLAPTGADLVVGSDFVQNGNGLNSIGGNITSTNDGISFATGVTLTNNVTMTSGLLAGDDISFATAIRSDVSTTRDLTLTAGLGDIALTDGTSTTTLLDAILINSARNVVVGDAITATSFIQLAGTGSTTFAGTLLLTGALTVNAGTSAGNTITFASTVGSVTASSISLNTLASSARATPATVATIVSGGNIAFSSGTFDMGLNQKLTGLGNITIGGLLPATNATTVTLGDVNAVGNLSVNSAVINLRARASGPIVTNTGGTITDPIVDYIVGGRVFFSVAPVMVGSGGRAVFANTSGNIDANGTLGGFVTSIYQSPITVGLLTGAGGQILDLSVANTVALLNPANIIPPQMSILPPIGVLGSSDELEQNEKKKAKPEAQGSKKTASETPKTAPGIPVALR